MAKKTILEALTRVKMLARPHESCCALRRDLGLNAPPVKTPEPDCPRSGLRVFARSVSLKHTRRNCGYRGRRTCQGMTSRWCCPATINTISGEWLDLS